MILILGGIAVALAALPGLLRPLGRKLHPADWARAAAVGFAGSLVAGELTLILLAAPTMLHTAGVHALAAACARMAGRLSPGGPLVGWFAAALAVMLPVAAGAGLRRARAAQRRLDELALVGRRRNIAGCDVVVVDDERPLAVSVDAHGGVVVLSSALLEQLHDAELDVVVRHELAHLAHRHHRLLLLAATAQCALGFLPWVRGGVDGLRCAIERWADEDAAGQDPLARGATRRALVTVAVGGVSVDTAAFGALATVVERVAALDQPTPRRSASRSLLTLTPLVAPAVGALAITAIVAAQFSYVLTMPVFCAT